MDDTERRAGLYVITRGTRVGWSVSGVSLLVSASERVMSLTRPISWLRKNRLYPRLLRYVLSSLVCPWSWSVKVSSEEQIRRSLRAKINGIALLVCLGWHEDCNKY